MGYRSSLDSLASDCPTSLVEQSVGEAYGNIQTVVDNLISITTVSTGINDINALALISADITTVAGLTTELPIVSGLAVDIPIVAANAADIALAAENILAIQNAPAAALAAESSASAAALSESNAATSEANAASTLASAVKIQNNGSDFENPAEVLANIGAMSAATYDPNNIAADIFDKKNHSGFTLADVATKTIPAIVMSFVVAGFAAFGDGAQGAEYFRTGAQPEHALYEQDASGAFFELRSNKVKLSQAGAFPDTGTSQHVQIQNALDYIIHRGGGTVDVDKPGEYLTNGVIQAADYSCKIVMTNSGRGVIKAAAGLANNVLMFGQVSGGPTGEGEAHLYDIRIDNSEGVYVVGDNSCTALSFRLLNRVYVYNPVITGGYDPIVGNNGFGGDSGIGITQCNFGVIVNPDIWGQPDTAIYPSWNNNGPNNDGSNYGESGGTVIVIGGHLRRNNNSITPKRNLTSLIVYGGLHEEQAGGIINSWVFNAGGDVEGCKSIFVEGVKFKKITSNHIRSTYNTKLTVRNCRVEDVGYKYDGTGNVGGNARCLVLFGTKGAVIENIEFEMVEWAPVAEYAVYENTDTASPTTYLGGGHSIRGLTFKNWSRTYVAPVGVTDEAALFDDLYYTDGSTPFFSGESADYQFCYKLQGDAARYERKGGVINKFGRPRGPLTIDLSSLGVLAARSKTPVQTYTATGVDTSCIIKALEKLSVFSNAAELQWSGRCLANSVELSFFNASDAGYDLTGRSIKIHFEYV